MIDEQTATSIARAAAEKEGWAFADPVRCVLRRTWRGAPSRWEIRTNDGRRGSIARFVIDAGDGTIIEKGYISR
jgi:hypothetical protein